MARIAFVESYPYETVRAGDGVYLDAIRQHLYATGHDVHNFITDISRGRTKPVVNLRPGLSEDRPFTIRGAIGVGHGKHLSIAPATYLNAAMRLATGRFLLKDAPSAAEARWLRRRLARLQPDFVVLIYDACELLPWIGEWAGRTMAIRGFFAERASRLDSDAASQPSAIRPRSWQALPAAARAAFNSISDLRCYEELSGAENGAFVGMHFPQRIATLPATEPIVLFVGVHSVANLQGIHWFMARCWDTIRTACPDARLRIVGSVGKGLSVKAGSGIEICGFIENLNEEYACAQMVIAPLLIGTNGVKTKVGEAFSHGRPLVTTSLGVDSSNPGQFADAADVVDTPEGLAAAVIRLLADADLRSARSRRAEAIYHQHFTEHAAYRALDEMLQP